MNERIVSFFHEQRSATVCCVDEEGKPYCFTVFYAFDAQQALLYFKTSANTRHTPLLQQNAAVAGTVHPDKLNAMALKGIQFTGSALPPDAPLSAKAAGVYHKKYPFARAMKGEVWTVQLATVKMTDNTLSFGKKLLWEATANEAVEA